MKRLLPWIVVLVALRGLVDTSAADDKVVSRAVPDPTPFAIPGWPRPVHLRTEAFVLSQGEAAKEPLPVEKLLKDPNPDIRMNAALAQAKARNVAAFPVLIELLAVLPVEKRSQVEEVLHEWAGEWAPAGGPAGEDEIARRIRRDAWAGWWANTEGSALLSMLEKRTLSPGEQKKVTEAIKRLGDNNYAAREKAVIELVARGRMILPLLREVLKKNEPEVVRRAQGCIQRIEEEPAHRLPSAALRVLGLRKPTGAAEALLAYLPFAEEENLSEAHSALALLATQNGKPNAALVRALTDPQSVIRAAAAEALAQGGGPEGSAAARKVLEDADLSVRLRAALALAPRDAQAIPVLIDLIAALSADQAAQIHDFLTHIAGEKAPTAPGDNIESRKTSSAAWAAWWKENAPKADLARLSRPEQHRLGYTVICEWNTGKIMELGPDRKLRWSFGGTQNPVDALVVPNNRVLIAEFTGQKVTERDFKGTIIWQKQVNGNPHNVQRLPNGHTFIATNNQIVEVDRTGKEVFALNANQMINIGQLSGAYKSRKGHIICMSQAGRCAHLDSTGKQLKGFNTNIGGAYMDLLPNGRVLISQNGGNRIAEYDPEGKLLLELNYQGVSGISGLPSGNILVTSNTSGRVVELDRKGKVVWEFLAQGPFRARGR